MKKFFSLLICIQLSIIPMYADYDFSDEAQEAFNRQQQQSLQSVDFSKARSKNEIKNNSNNQIWTPTPVEEPVKTENKYQHYQGDLFQEIQTQQPTPKQLHGSVVKIPSGTKFDVTFDSGVSSGSMAKNDRLTVRLTNDLTYNGQLIVPAGSLVYGSATDANNAGYAYGSGSIAINFNEILTPDGNMLQIKTKNIVMSAKSQRAVKMTRDVVLGALGSMLLGAAFTALGGGNDWGRNMLIYGGVGALGGGIHGAMQRGEEIQIPDGTTIQVTLTEPLTTNPYSIQY